MANRVEVLLRFAPAVFIAAALMFLTAACGGGNGGAPSGGGATGSISVQPASNTLTVPAGGSIGHLGVAIVRSGVTGSVSLDVSGLPAGSSATFIQPQSGGTGEVDVNPGTAAMGTFPIEVQATDGAHSATAKVSLVINAGIKAQLPGPFSWHSTAPLISAIPDATHPILAVKDPSVVFFNNVWNVYATTATDSAWSLQYINFSDWSQAAAAKPYYMDENPNLTGYHAAPEVFYFQPQSKWYLIFQSGQPQYSTADDPTQPSTWSPPKNFFATQPVNVPNWIDFWVICDSSNCYLFFSGDDGRFWRSETSLANFPNGFGTPQLVMQTANAFDLFEASCTYYLQGLNQYLTIIECIDSSGRRYFRSFVTDRLDSDDWTPNPQANTSAQPFAGINNVTFDAGVTPWTTDISHGEMLRAGYDQTLTIDPNNLQFLYQGTSSHPSNYIDIPWQLGLLH